MDSAPVLAIALLVSVGGTIGGIYLVSRLFLRAWESSEEERARNEERRGALYAEHSQRQTQSVVEAMDRGTAALDRSTIAQQEAIEVLGGVRELMRSIQDRRAG